LAPRAVAGGRGGDLPGEQKRNDHPFVPVRLKLSSTLIA
jgi:hypothetical protein